tara:strand:- start:1843 stop:3555 length:1713 start_codon:yes stop_codon:yes gene_type:complete
MNKIDFLNSLYKRQTGFYNLNFLKYSINYIKEKEIFDFNLENEIITNYDKKISNENFHIPDRKEYPEKFNKIYSGKLPTWILEEYIKEVLYSINTESKDLFKKIFEDEFKGVLNSFNELIKFHHALILNNEYFTNKCLLEFGFKKDFLNKFLNHEDELIIFENNKYILGIFDFFIPEILNLISQLELVKQFDKKYKGNIGEKLVLSTLKKYFKDKKIKIYENIYYICNKDNKEYELDLIIEYDNLIFLGSIKNKKIDKNTRKNLFIDQINQTKRFHESLLLSKKVDIYNKSLRTKSGRVEKIKTFEYSKNLDIIHLGISTEHISDFINLYEEPVFIKDKDKEFLLNRIVISYGDLLCLFNLYKYNHEIFHYFYIRSQFSKNKFYSKNKEIYNSSIGFLDDELQHFYLYNQQNNYFSFINSLPCNKVYFGRFEQEVVNLLQYKYKYNKYQNLSKKNGKEIFLYEFLNDNKNQINWNIIKELYNANGEFIENFFNTLENIKNNNGYRNLKSLHNLDSYSIIICKNINNLNKLDKKSISQYNLKQNTLIIYYENNKYKIKILNRKEMKSFLHK